MNNTHQNHNLPADEAKRALAEFRTVAVLGAHHDLSRPAGYVPDFLCQKGVRILPVNPQLAGQILWREPVRRSLADLQTPVDAVVVFRRAEALPGHLDEILAMAPRPPLVWLQLGIVHDVFAKSLAVAGIRVVQDRCTLADFQRWQLPDVTHHWPAGTARLTVLASGNGSNFGAILQACADGTLPARVSRLVVDKSGAYARERARQAGVADTCFPFGLVRDAGGDRTLYDQRLAELVAATQPDVIVLAGFMRILSEAFLAPFGDRVLNLHPALPGQFAGTHAIERAHAAFQQGEITHTGCMVHRVIPEVDAGEPLDVEQVPILASDSVDDLATRMHEAEHRLLVRALRAELRRRGY